ncbi:MAG: GNAT family N-acetyltransferase [Deltaproteobacteria bacterium]|nr:GNAT family N-acetyltransferase [Deltaproteobacteria bacterium]
MVDEMRTLGERIWEWQACLPGETPAAFVQRVLRAEHSPAPGRVPSTVHWAVLDGEVVGRIALRHVLDENLRRFGGHVGYEVRPSARRRGIASEMLRLLLQTPRARAIGRLLVTCSPDNIGSRKAILANGGVLEKVELVEAIQRDTCFYWIDAGVAGARSPS